MGITDKRVVASSLDAMDSDKQLQMIAALREATARLESNRRQYSEPIAVIGMACRFPGCDNADEYWDLLGEGRCAIQPVPADRWNRDDFVARGPKEPGKISFNGGGFITDVDSFDARFFEITQREARSLDPQQRLLLEVAWSSLEHAGIRPQSLYNQRCGVFTGICSNDYLLKMSENRFDKIDPYLATGNAHATAAGRISYFMHWQGPAMSVDTACSSSLVAVHLAMQSIRNLECDMAIAMGVNLILAPNLSIGLSQAGMLSPTGSSRAFASGADGFVRGEGCGAVLLKRLSHAQSDGDRIFCVLRSSAVNQDGHSNGLTAPNGLAQQDVIRSALLRGGLAPSDIDYIEAHGTGTELGDPIEMGAIASVFTPRNLPLTIGSVKTNIGHLEGAAGIAGFIKTCLSLHHESIPSHLNFDQPSPHIDWQSGLTIPKVMTSWPRKPSRVRRAGVSSFGFGGTNAHVILEEAPLSPSATVPIDTPAELRGPNSLAKSYWLKVSAKSPEAFSELAQSYASALSDNSANRELSSACLDEVSFAGNVGRSDFAYRGFIQFSNRTELVSRLFELADLKTSSSNSVQRGFGIRFDGNEQHPRSDSEWSRAMHSYLNGQAVDWDLLYASKLGSVSQPTKRRRTISLPTYPFQRQRCWFKLDSPVETKLNSDSASACNPTLKSPSRIIPGLNLSFNSDLLGARLDIGGDCIIYETDLVRFSELAGHRVRGESLFPAAGFLELAMAAGLETNGSLFAVEGLSLELALRWTPGVSTRVQVILYSQPIPTSRVGDLPSPMYRGEILSRQISGWRKHASFQLTTSIPDENHLSLKQPIGVQQCCVDSHYSDCESIGLEYTGAFQSLREIWTFDSTAFGTVEITRHIEESAEALNYLLHPALLDGCLQSICALVEEKNSLWLPVSVQRYQYCMDVGKSGNCRGPLKFSTDLQPLTDEANRSAAGSDERIANIKIYNADGMPLALVEGLVIRCVGGVSSSTSDAYSEFSEKSWQLELAGTLPLDGNENLIHTVEPTQATSNGARVALQIHLQKKLASIIECDENEIVFEERLENMGLDSLMAYEFLHDIEEIAGIRVPMERLLGGMNLNQVVDYVQSRQGARGTSTPTATEWIEGAI